MICVGVLILVGILILVCILILVSIQVQIVIGHLALALIQAHVIAIFYAVVTFNLKRVPHRSSSDSGVYTEFGGLLRIQRSTAVLLLQLLLHLLELLLNQHLLRVYLRRSGLSHLRSVFGVVELS